MEENFDIKGQYTIKNLPDPTSIGEAASKLYVDKKFNDPSIRKNTAHIESNVKNLDNFRFIRLKSYPGMGEHATPKYFVDQAISNSVNESSLLKSDPHEESKLAEQVSLILNACLTSSKTILGIPTKSHVDSLSENDRNRRDLWTVFAIKTTNLMITN